MRKEEYFNTELQKLLGNIKQKINNDDILSKLLYDNADYVFEVGEDWSITYGKEIIELYKKLSILVDKLSKIS